MPLPDSASIQKYVQTLISRTRSGDFVWKKINPSTYLWDTDDARLTIQKLPGTTTFASGEPFKLKKNFLYTLQVYELLGGGKISERLKLDGEIDDQVNDRLESLFDLIQTGITEKGLDFLAHLIGPNK